MSPPGIHFWNIQKRLVLAPEKMYFRCGKKKKTSFWWFKSTILIVLSESPLRKKAFRSCRDGQIQYYHLWIYIYILPISCGWETLNSPNWAWRNIFIPLAPEPPYHWILAATCGHLGMIPQKTFIIIVTSQWSHCNLNRNYPMSRSFSH